jgi:hypothetical protein
MRDDLLPDAADLESPEPAAGYDRFRRRFATSVERCGPVHCTSALDVAGTYAVAARSRPTNAPVAVASHAELIVGHARIECRTRVSARCSRRG